MTRPTISLVIPTISRPALARCLASVRRQDWWPGDEIILIGDQKQPIARSLFEQFHLPGYYVDLPVPGGFWGHAARNWLLDTKAAKGDYLAALDDDELTPDAVKIVRAALAEAPDRPHLFRMSGVPGIGTVWKDREIREGNVGTPTFLAPNDPTKLGRYTPRYGGDADFCKTTVAMYPPDSVVWREEVICRVRPPR